MSISTYTFNVVSNATVASDGSTRSIANKTFGDNQFILTAKQLTKIDFVTQSLAGQYTVMPTGAQIGDVVIAMSATGIIYTQAQTSSSWHPVSTGLANSIYFKILSSSNDLVEVVTSSVSYPAPSQTTLCLALFRPNATINKVYTNEFSEVTSTNMVTLSYSGSVEANKKPAIAIASYRSNDLAFQNELVQYSSEVGMGSGSTLSMTYLENAPHTGPNTSYLWMKYKTYYGQMPLVDMNLQYNAGNIALNYGSLHFD